MKQIQYTKEQELVKQVLEKVYKKLKSGGNGLHETINEVAKSYGIEREKYLTLREYINKNSIGAYHHFVFTINYVKINVIGSEDFEKIYNKDLLDKYYVVQDDQICRGNNCCNYECEHHLELELKED